MQQMQRVRDREFGTTLLYFTILYSTLIYFTLLFSNLLHFTSLHFTSLHSLCFTSFHFTSPHFTSLYFARISHTEKTRRKMSCISVPPQRLTPCARSNTDAARTHTPVRLPHPAPCPPVTSPRTSRQCSSEGTMSRGEYFWQLENVEGRGLRVQVGGE